MMQNFNFEVIASGDRLKVLTFQCLYFLTTAVQSTDS